MCPRNPQPHFISAIYSFSLGMAKLDLAIPSTSGFNNIHRLPLAATGHSPAIQEKPEENAEGGDDAGGGARLPTVG